ncbi:dihydrolipoyl dehydrogenase [Chitinophaga nivalis]|uniref:Dihydrolipoyl dehydrogenase n=1 Tax=Chitinophaga nivalis TaxID=2991709 RepID=A0ABT3IJX8_9BACT|nr:dihydrolipoyl dehydrogenase [Chitinophaga nivalis]MCW3466034.1 dihydrolipoyl dehydrogenase [Chitinophaga nivalis]MCW3484275.1 dihydrolipoyl dehydrogenase [Chitinophaga nivalis]
MDNQYDVVVIGSGPGGYVAAIRAAQLGSKVAIVEKYNTLGGTCTNVGCIPTKALLDSSERYHQAQEQFQAHGIQLNGIRLDFEQFIRRKADVIKQNTAGLAYLMKKNKIDVHTGTGSFIDATHLRVVAGEQETILTGRYFIIATGSKPSSLPGISIDKKRIITSTESLSLPAIPASMVIIGGGVIGVELASIYARIGTRVTIIEYTDSLIATMDRELGKALYKTLSALKINILLGSQVQGATAQGETAEVRYLDQQGQAQTITADYCLVAVGRRPYTDGLHLEAVGIVPEKNGKIAVNAQLQTTVANIYAIGDVVAGPMLAHKAEEEGTFAAEIIHGHHPRINYQLIPSVVYTWPEVAAVGATEEQLKAQGITYRVGKFPYLASARARASMDAEGFVKVLVSPQYGEILGVHIIGPRAADVIAQPVAAIEHEITVEEMFRISYAHPTYAEALKDAYLMAGGQGAINI